MTDLTTKAQRRTEARAIIAALPAAVRAEQAARLTELILASPEWLAAQRPLLFIPQPDEVDLAALIPAGLIAGKRVCLPAFDPETGTYRVREIRDAAKDLIPGRFRIPEPGPQCRTVRLGELDFLLVPGLAFDAAGGRLGRGKGFYDRLLALASGTIWGVGFVEQVGLPLPHELHDQRLHGVFTAEGLQTGLRSK